MGRWVAVCEFRFSFLPLFSLCCAVTVLLPPTGPLRPRSPFRKSTTAISLSVQRRALARRGAISSPASIRSSLSPDKPKGPYSSSIPIRTGKEYFVNPQYDTVVTNTSTSLTELWSPRFSTSANFGFIHDYTLESALQTSGIITQMAERYQYTTGGGVKYALTENLSLQASGSYSDTTYPSHQSGLSDEQAYQVTVTPMWSITPRNDIGLSSTFSTQDYTSFSSETNTVTEMVTWKRLLNETASFELSAGYYLTWSSYVTQVLRFIPPNEIVLLTLPGSGSGSGPAATVSLKKDWSERFSTTLMANKSQYSDTYARSFDQSTIGFSVGYRLSELTTLNFSSSYDMNDQASQGTEKIDYVSIGPSIERRISENLTARLRGSYNWRPTAPTGRRR